MINATKGHMVVVAIIVFLSAMVWTAYWVAKGMSKTTSLARELTATDLAAVTPCVREQLLRALHADDSTPLRVADLAVAQTACERKRIADAQRAVLVGGGESGAD